MSGFWQWFSANEERLFSFELDQEAIFDEVSARLAAIDQDLTFEFGPVVEGRREFVISAGGHKGAFGAVERLGESAPPLSRFVITCFRPRRGTISNTELRGKRLDPRDVEIVLLHDGRQAGLYVFVRGYDGEDLTVREMVYLMLDEALGEYCVETQVGLIKVFPQQHDSGGERVPIRELPARFDDLMRRLHGAAQQGDEADKAR